MSSIRVIQGDFEKKLKLQFAPGIKAGFHPNVSTLLSSGKQVTKYGLCSIRTRYRHHAHNNSGIFQPIIAYDGKICGNWSPFKEAFHASFFEEDFESEDVSETWQSYNSYRNK